jgi:hypothetical protein
MMEDANTAILVLSGKHPFQIAMQEALQQIEEIDLRSLTRDHEGDITDGYEDVVDIEIQQRQMRVLFISSDLIGYPKMFDDIVPQNLYKRFREDPF